MALKKRRLVPIVAISMALWGCGGMTQTGSVPRQANLQLSSSALSFGSVSVGSTKTNNLTISNTSASGGPAITVSHIDITGVGFSVTPAGALPLVLAVGQSSTIVVSFTPTSTGTVNGNLSIVPESMNSINVPLSGSALSSPGISVTVSPSSATLQVGQSQQFNASVSGTSNTAVTWMVNGTAGGNSTVGTISASGLYTAPTTVPSSAVVVTAQSVAQTTASASATVSITAAPVISVSISPVNPSLQVGKLLQFTAQVSGTSNTAVNWLVSGVLGGNTSLGTISSTGLYTAPANVPSAPVTVEAQSASNTNSFATTSVTITASVAHHVDLSWTASVSSVAGYNIYRSTQAAGPFTKINPSLDTATVYTDSAVVSGQTYYYTTTAVGSNGAESLYSNMVQVAIP